MTGDQHGVKGTVSARMEVFFSEASDYVLENMGREFKPRPQDDLYALARTVYCYILRPDLPKSRDEQSRKEIHEFWRSQSRLWQKIFSLAEKIECNNQSTYDDFKESLCEALSLKSDLVPHAIVIVLSMESNY